MAIPCIKDELRLNKFEHHSCLSSKDIYKKFGARSQSASSSEDSANFSRNPLEMADLDYQHYAEALAQEARERAEQARIEREKQEKARIEREKQEKDQSTDE